MGVLLISLCLQACVYLQSSWKSQYTVFVNKLSLKSSFSGPAILLRNIIYLGFSMKVVILLCLVGVSLQVKYQLNSPLKHTFTSSGVLHITAVHHTDSSVKDGWKTNILFGIQTCQIISKILKFSTLFKLFLLL